MEIWSYLFSLKFIIQIFFAVTTFAAVIIMLSWGDRRKMTTKQLKKLDKHREDLFDKQKAETTRKKKIVHKSIYERFIEKFNLSSLLENKDIHLMCARAGLRGKTYPMIYIFFIFVTPIVFFLGGMIYFFSIGNTEHSATMKIIFSLAIGACGAYFPKLVMINKITKRQKELGQFFPDTLDLLIICVESGMSIEASFNKIGQEIGKQSMTVSEEISITTAEISFLEDRRSAYENLAKRANLPAFKALTTALIQSEKYGTPLGQSLRVLSQEQREQLFQLVEKKAAALPAKLTVPMILFFLPVLFVVILGPAIIQVMNLKQ